MGYQFDTLLSHNAADYRTNRNDLSTLHTGDLPHDLAVDLQHIGVRPILHFLNALRELFQILGSCESVIASFE